MATKRGRVMAMRLVVLLAAAFSGCAWAADAAPPGGGQGQQVAWRQECQRVKSLQPPEADIPSPRLAARLAECDAEYQYYQVQTDPHAMPEDWARVRACAFAARDTDVLMMLYANGFGVGFNRDLALKYACEVDRYRVISPQSLVEAINGLEFSAAETGNTFDVCDYADGTPAIALCSGTRELQADFRRNRRLDEIARAMTPAQKTAFARLRKAAREWAYARADEVVAEERPVAFRALENGTAGDELDQFLAQVENCEQRQFPRDRAEEFAPLDRGLNDSYAAVLHTARDSMGEHDVLAESIRQGERAWLKYRNAWVAFGKLRYPQVPGDVWKVWLTAGRLAQLDELGDEAAQ